MGNGVGFTVGRDDGLGVGTLVGWNVGSGVGCSGCRTNDVTVDARVTEPPVVKELLSKRRWVEDAAAKVALGTLHEHTVLVLSKDTTVHVTPVAAVAVDGTRPPHVGVT